MFLTKVQLMNPSNAQVTLYLNRWFEGDAEAMHALIPLIYDELKQLASAKLARRPDSILNPTALLHEVYLRLVGHQPKRPWNHRGELFALCSKMMLQVLADWAKHKHREKRGGAQVKLTLDSEWDGIAPSKLLDALVLQELILRYEGLDKRACHVWLCRFLWGLTMVEIAAIFKLSETTLHRDLRAAGAWLGAQLRRCQS